MLHEAITDFLLLYIANAARRREKYRRLGPYLLFRHEGREISAWLLLCHTL